MFIVNKVVFDELYVQASIWEASVENEEQHVVTQKSRRQQNGAFTSVNSNYYFFNLFLDIKSINIWGAHFMLWEDLIKFNCLCHFLEQRQKKYTFVYFVHFWFQIPEVILITPAVIFLDFSKIIINMAADNS